MQNRAYEFLVPSGILQFVFVDKVPPNLTGVRSICAIRILVGEKHIGIDVTKWDERRELAGFLEEMAEKLRGG